MKLGRVRDLDFDQIPNDDAAVERLPDLGLPSLAGACGSSGSRSAVRGPEAVADFGEADNLQVAELEPPGRGRGRGRAGFAADPRMAEELALQEMRQEGAHRVRLAAARLTIGEDDPDLERPETLTP